MRRAERELRDYIKIRLTGYAIEEQNVKIYLEKQSIKIYLESRKTSKVVKKHIGYSEG